MCLKSIFPILFDSDIHSSVLSTTKKELPVEKVGFHCCLSLCLWKHVFSVHVCSDHSVCPLLPSVLQKKRYVKKHLFSDTDTENAMTEVSWLRESARRSKPKVTKYSRQAPIKPRAVPQHGSCRRFKPRLSLWKLLHHNCMFIKRFRSISDPIHALCFFCFFLIAVESPDLLPSFPKAVMDNNKPTKVRND